MNIDKYNKHDLLPKKDILLHLFGKEMSIEKALFLTTSYNDYVGWCRFTFTWEADNEDTDLVDIYNKIIIKDRYCNLEIVYNKPIGENVNGRKQLFTIK